MNKNSTKCAIMDICKTAFIVIFSITIIISVHAVPPATANVKAGVEHVVVFDAGSSGTRVHVFNLYKREDGGLEGKSPISGRHLEDIKDIDSIIIFIFKVSTHMMRPTLKPIFDIYIYNIYIIYMHIYMQQGYI